MTLLSKLESKRNEKRKKSRVASNDARILIDDMMSSEYNEYEIKEDRKRMMQAVKEISVLDSSGEFHIINYFQRAKSLGSRNVVRPDISLVTQSSVSKLYHLETIASRWHGLMSVTVFALSYDIPFAIEAILLLRRCFPSIRYNTSFHLVFPLSVPPPAIGATTMQPRPSIQPSLHEHNCANVMTIIQSMQPGVMNYAHAGVPYPNNLLRNVARRNSLTQYVFVIDIDLIPSDTLYEQFNQFAKDNNLYSDSQKETKVVFVVPAYEVKESTYDPLSSSHANPNDLIPRHKTSLLQMVEVMEARPFYFELCWKCQKYTDYDAWQREPAAAKLAVLFEVLWRDPWEPFYISRNNVPFYDERFRQYGFNRISQVFIHSLCNMINNH